jgi:ketosteroid isomerase-like protein
VSEELVQLVQQGHAAWNLGDRGWVLEHMAEDVEWITPTDDPDPGTYRGLEVSDRVIQVFEFEGEKCHRVREYYDRDAALSAARGDRSRSAEPAAEPT